MRKGGFGRAKMTGALDTRIHEYLTVSAIVRRDCRNSSNGRGWREDEPTVTGLSFRTKRVSRPTAFSTLFSERPMCHGCHQHFRLPPPTPLIDHKDIGLSTWISTYYGGVIKDYEFATSASPHLGRPAQGFYRFY